MMFIYLLFLLGCYEYVSAFSFAQLHVKRSTSVLDRSRSEQTTLWSSSLSSEVDDNVGEISSSSLRGLMSDKDFAYRSALHNTLNNLRHQLPRTLTIPIKADEAKRTYAEDCNLIGPKGEILGSDREEIMSVSQTIATTIGTARRAGQLLAAAASSGDKKKTKYGPGGLRIDFGLNSISAACQVVDESARFGYWGSSRLLFWIKQTKSTRGPRWRQQIIIIVIPVAFQDYWIVYIHLQCGWIDIQAPNVARRDRW